MWNLLSPGNKYIVNYLTNNIYTNKKYGRISIHNMFKNRNPLKVPSHEIFFLEKWSYCFFRSLKWQWLTQKKPLKNKDNIIFRCFLWMFRPCNFVSMRKKSTHCIAQNSPELTLRGPKVRGVKIEGSKTLRANLPSIFAPRIFGPLNLWRLMRKFSFLLVQLREG